MQGVAEEPCWDLLLGEDIDDCIIMHCTNKPGTAAAAALHQLEDAKDTAATELS